VSGRGKPEASSSAGAAPGRSARTTLAEVQPLLLRPDAARTVLKPFIIDDGDGSHAPRTRRIIERVLTLGPAELRRENEALSRFLEGRHPNVEAAILDRYEQLKQYVPLGATLTPDQMKVVGAYFSEEYAFESAALFNPSVVPHPDQSDVADGATRVLISLRGIGEGHVSALTFRSGVWGADGRIVLEDASRYALGPVLSRAEGPEGQLIAHLSFDSVKDLSETVVYPFMPSQGRGIEDVRLVAFTEDDGAMDYRGTYTAFNGTEVRQGLLRTSDFRTYEVRGVQGSHYAGKGMALFPRRVDGRYMMLARQDNENIWLVASDDPWAWEGGEMILSPRYPWEFIQIGNCGSPIELDEGWLVLTHGVGSARKYCIGACLLDKENPKRLLGRLAEPLLEPDEDMRDGYVPNVIYSCGALLRGRTLLLPFGVADNFTGFATVEVDKLLKALV
jgi:predicted GH43/DUF377 family glycosyl hydrolase